MNEGDDDDDDAIKTIAREQEQMLSTHRIVIIMMPLFQHSFIVVCSLPKTILTYLKFGSWEERCWEREATRRGFHCWRIIKFAEHGFVFLVKKVLVNCSGPSKFEWYSI